MRIGYELRKKRKELRLTQTELAQKIGVHQTSISQFEKERCFPNIKTLYRLCYALQISPDFIFKILETESKI